MSPRAYDPPGIVPDVLKSHFAEAAFLYSQRRRFLTRAEARWGDTGKLEERLEPHIEGLVVGGLEAFGLFGERLGGGEDAGESFAVASMTCRMPFVEPMEMLEEALANPEAPWGELVDALSLCREPSVRGWLERFLSGSSPRVRRGALRAWARRAEPSESPRALLADPEPSVAVEAARTVFVLEGRASADAMAPHAVSPDPETAKLALEVLLCLGDDWALDQCVAPAGAGRGPGGDRLPLMAIAGGRTSAVKIREAVARRPEIAPDAWIALGLAGDPASGETLLGRLEGSWDLKTQWPEYLAVCQGLRLLSGKDLLPGFGPDEADAAVLAAFAGCWRSLWAESAKTFVPGARIRRGDPVSPTVLAHDLKWDGHPRRDLCHFEMVVRYRCPVRFDAEALFADQRRAAEEIAAWASRVERDFKPGQYYYHAKHST